MDQSFRLSETLITDIKKIIPFATRIAGKILALTGSDEEAFNVKLALEEALTNAMRHGNRLDPALKVSVSIQADKKKIVLDVHDEGEGFDFERLPDPTTGAYVERPSGRGIFLMRKLMDSLEFYDGGRGIKMVKKFAPKP
jgi:serine/threonine-protein kinase RsbW